MCENDYLPLYISTLNVIFITASDNDKKNI